MSWLRNSPLRTSFAAQRSQEESPPKDVDPTACYDSFRKHWQQSFEIIQHSQPPNRFPTLDDYISVVNLIDRMTTLLLIELRCSASIIDNQRNASGMHSPCLEYLLSENLLGKIYDWSVQIGKYKYTIRMEQMKLYEILVSYNGILLAHEPVARPLLRLLKDCTLDLTELEHQRLIALLNRLCIALMQNNSLLDLFFHPNDMEKDAFIILKLLMPHIHTAGDVGQQARDAMMLCMTLSRKNNDVGVYIAETSKFCPHLATSLSDLYGTLPKKLDIEASDWHRLTPDDVNDIPQLLQFVKSFEFCNAMAQISHTLVRDQLLEFLYHGFLVPVMGYALLQNPVEELVASTAYFDLFLRSAQEPGLLHSLLRFLLEYKYDEYRVLDILIQRIMSKSRELCIVTLALFETLVNLNCEDVMLELCLKDLSPCSHVMLSQRRRLRDIDPFGRSAERFLSLSPSCCISILNLDDSPLSLRWRSNTSPQFEVLKNNNSTTTTNITGKLYEGSLYGNYHAYLSDAKQKITMCQLSCSHWSNKYDGECQSRNGEFSTNGAQSIKTPEPKRSTYSTSSEFSSTQQVLDSVQSFVDFENTSNFMEDVISMSPEIRRCPTLSVEEEAQLDADIAELLAEHGDKDDEQESSETSVSEATAPNVVSASSVSDKSSSTYPISLLYSSGYNSLSSKRDEEEEIESKVANVFKIRERSFARREEKQKALVQEVFEDKPSVGAFLDTVFKKLEDMMVSDVYVNLHLTGLISRLAIYPQPLLQSFLLNYSIVFQPSIRWLFQVLASLKHKIDQFLSKYENVDAMIEQARTALIRRENMMVNVKKCPPETSKHSPVLHRHSLTGESLMRNECEPKRKSLTSSLTQMLRRSLGSTGSSGMETISLSSTSDASGLDDNINRLSWDCLTKVTHVQNVVLCAIVLDEWLKELAAITQEHAIMSLSNLKSY